MLTATMFGDDGVTKQITDHDEISDVLAAGGGLVWVDALDATEGDLTKIEEEFGLHPLAMEDVRHPGQRPKIERYDTHAYLIAYASNGDPQQLSELDVFVAQGWMVTIRHSFENDPCIDIDDVGARFDRTRREHNTVGFLLYTLLDAVVDTYFDALDRTEDQLEVIEGRIFTADTREERSLQERLLALRRELLMFRRRVVPLRDVLQVILRQEVQPIREDVQRYFQDVLDHILRVIDTLETQRELLGNAVDAHLAVVNNNMNQIMKKMTSWGAILFGAALITGVYGMNFDNIPELHWHYGYFMALGLMVLLTLGLYTWFRRRDWL
ncbi:MAG TPA: magnesium/cobalt transporter CorA [Acidimicrobiales bacterium]|nr:magnesium/cobalt transporter CorA [Acidimicrobiales bacterium]